MKVIFNVGDSLNLNFDLTIHFEKYPVELDQDDLKLHVGKFVRDYLEGCIICGK